MWLSAAIAFALVVFFTLRTKDLYPSPLSLIPPEVEEADERGVRVGKVGEPCADIMSITLVRVRPPVAARRCGLRPPTSPAGRGRVSRCARSFAAAVSAMVMSALDAPAVPDPGSSTRQLS